MVRHHSSTKIKCIRNVCLPCRTHAQVICNPTFYYICLYHLHRSNLLRNATDSESLASQFSFLSSSHKYQKCIVDQRLSWIAPIVSNLSMSYNQNPPGTNYIVENVGCYSFQWEKIYTIGKCGVSQLQGIEKKKQKLTMVSGHVLGDFRGDISLA